MAANRGVDASYFVERPIIPWGTVPSYKVEGHQYIAAVISTASLRIDVLDDLVCGACIRNHGD